MFIFLDVELMQAETQKHGTEDLENLRKIRVRAILTVTAAHILFYVHNYMKISNRRLKRKAYTSV